MPATVAIISLPKEVEVLKRWREAFRAEMTCRLSQAIFGLLEPGMTVNVRFDLQHQARVLLIDDVNALLHSRVQK